MGSGTPDQYYREMESTWATDYPSGEDIGEYESFFDEIGVDRNLREMVAHLVGFVDVQKKRLLEFGCDTGILLSFFRPYFEDLVGLDINQKALDRGKEMFPDLDLRKNNGVKIPFEDDSFDTVLLSAVLKHIRPEDRDDLYGELKRVAPTIIVIDETRDSPSVEEFGNFRFYRSDLEKELGERFQVLHAEVQSGYLFGVYNRG